MKHAPLRPDQLSLLPHTPGVYIYKNAQGLPIYIGKAKNLSRRVRQYFSGVDAVGDKTRVLVSQIATVETVSVPTEFDALLLEAQLIRKHLPKYNIIARDDKSRLYIVIFAKEPFPRIVQMRKTQIAHIKTGLEYVYGPFQSATIVKNILRSIRRIIPYCTQKFQNGTPCFHTHIGLCNPCPSVVAHTTDANTARNLRRMYRRQIYHIRDILSGKTDAVLRVLQNEMVRLAGNNRFEEASAVKQQISSLRGLRHHTLDPMIYMQKTSQADDIYETERVALQDVLIPYFPTMAPLVRIECIDISHTSGFGSAGSLVVFISGLSDTSLYRRFRIRLNKENRKPFDSAMIAEVISRRLTHKEWPYPDLIIVDGGKAQVSAATRILIQHELHIPVIGLAKRMEEIVINKSDGQFTVIRLPYDNAALHLLERIRDEAHRFAKTYHISIRKNVLSIGTE